MAVFLQWKLYPLGDSSVGTYKHFQEIKISEFLYFRTSKIVFRILFIESLYINILTRQ